MADLDPHAIEYAVSPGKKASSRDDLVDDVKAAWPFDAVRYEGGSVVFFYNEWIGNEDELNLGDCVKELGWIAENF